MHDHSPGAPAPVHSTAPTRSSGDGTLNGVHRRAPGAGRASESSRRTIVAVTLGIGLVASLLLAGTSAAAVSPTMTNPGSGGTRESAQQANIRLPSDLTPTLADANDDVPVAAEEPCHSRYGETRPGSCKFLKHGTKLVLLIGDSHAVQWFPAIYRVAKERHWRFITMTKSACPLADVPTFREGKLDTACTIWRRNAFAKVKRLHPDMVIASQLDVYTFVGDGGHPTSPRSQARWGAGLRRSLVTLRKASGKVILLGDVQHWGRGAIPCLKAHPNNIGRCEVRADLPFQVKREKTARTASAAANVGYASTRKLSCPSDPCPLVVGRYLVTRDGGHLTATFSATLWRGVDKLLPSP